MERCGTSEDIFQIQESELKHVYLTSFVHREELFDIAERWLCCRPESNDGTIITQILICDGFVVWETVEALTDLLLGMIYEEPFIKKRLRLKGELRDAICRHSGETTLRVRDLATLYRNNPDFFFREAPINGVMYLDHRECLLGLYRVKRPRRIAEKSNRHIANWIFRMVQDRARHMAEERAGRYGIPLDMLLTPPHEMVREFREAEEVIAQGFKEGRIHLDKRAMTINDVGGIKIIVDEEKLLELQGKLENHPNIKILNRESHGGDYRDTSMVLEVPWDGELVCRKYADCRGWEKYLHQGIPEAKLHKDLASFLEKMKPTLNVELILCTFPDMVESELGNSIHEERILAQRDNKIYRGHIPMNVEFLIKYLFAVGGGPQTSVETLPIKLWGRYLPDTVSSHIRQLYNVPEYEFLF